MSTTPTYNAVHSLLTNDGVDPFWEIRAGDYPDEPDLVIVVLHAVDAEGQDASAAVAAQVVRALSNAPQDIHLTPFALSLDSEGDMTLADDEVIVSFVAKGRTAWSLADLRDVAARINAGGAA